MSFAQRTIGALLFVGLASCATTAEHEDSILDAVHRIIAADNARDLDAAVACYTPDAQWLPPQEPPIVGREALRARYAPMFASFQPAMKLTIDETWELGDTAVVRGSTSGELRSLSGGAPRVVDDKYIMVLRRDADGVWRILRLMWSPNRHD